MKKTKLPKILQRAFEKGQRKFLAMSPDERKAEAEKFVEMFDGLRVEAAKAEAEAEMLKAEVGRLRCEVWRTKVDLAEIAACIDAELCKKWPGKAVEQAEALMKAVEEVTARKSWREKADLARIAARLNPALCKSKPGEAIKLALELAMAIEKLTADGEAARKRTQAVNSLATIRMAYKRGLKHLTGEKNLDRAEPKFGRFLAATFPKEGEAEIRLKHYKERGFTGTEWAKLYRGYEPWWKQEKSRRARKSALAKKKQKGRVKRPKSDLRFTENRRHKQGYCQKCGERVRNRERLCDACLSGKPLLVQSAAEDAQKYDIDATLSAVAKETGALPDTYEGLFRLLDGETEV